MGQIAQTFQQLPSHEQSLTLGTVQYRLRLIWRERNEAWYADLETLDGTAIWQGQRVSTQWALGFGLEPVNKPEGQFFVRGPAEYDRESLGDTVQLVFYPDDELPAASADAFPVTVELN